MYHRRNTAARMGALLAVTLVFSLVVGATAFGATALADASGAGVPAVDERTGKVDNRYTLNIEFDPEAKTFTCDQTVEYVNNAQQPLDKLVFHVYAKAFESEDIAPFSKDDMRAAYPKGFSPGGCEFERVEVAGAAVTPVFSNATGSAMTLPLTSTLAPGETARVRFVYTVTVPRCNGRFGYDSDAFNMANCYPIAAIYDEEGWHDAPYYAVGDPFYSDVSDYDVTITAPKGYTLASSGTLTRDSERGDSATWHAVAENVRDFTWFASSKYKTVTKQVGDTTVSVYTYSKRAKAELALKAASDSVELFSKTFYPYPYESLSVVESGFFIGGMEYPNIVQIFTDGFDDDFMLEYVIAHEVGHQWFYQIVGNDEVEEPWLDESLTEYATNVYMRKNDPESARQSGAFMGRMGEYDINLPAYEYPDLYVYSASVYNDGLMMWLELESDMGVEAFQKVLSEYAHKYAYKNASAEDLLGMFAPEQAEWIRGALANRSSVKAP